MQHQLPRMAMSVDGTPVDTVPYVRDLGIYIDIGDAHACPKDCIKMLRSLKTTVTNPSRRSNEGEI